MPTVYHDRIQENFTSTGTADFAVSGAVQGYRPWSTLNDQDTAPYCAVDAATGAWEVGSALVTKAPVADASFANVVILTHFDGSNLSSTFNNVATISGAPTLTSSDSTYVYLTTATSKFGTASLSLPGVVAGASKSALVSASSANNIGTGDFTIEMFVRLKDFSSQMLFDYEQGFVGSNALGFGLIVGGGSGGALYFVTGGNISAASSVEWTIDNLWHAVAISRNSGTMRFFLDGVQVSSRASTHNFNQSLSRGFVIGGCAAAGRGDLSGNCYIDEFRFTVGVGRYTANYTPTSTIFGTDASSGAVTLARTPAFSSNTNGLVNFAAGTKQVFLTVPASFFSTPTGASLASNTFTGTQTLRAGAAGAATAPLKLQSGALNTTPEVGAVEFLTDKPSVVITTGAARKEFTLNDAALTSDRVPFATTNGRLTDTSNFKYDPTTNTLNIGGATPDADVRANAYGGNNGKVSIEARNTGSGTAAYAALYAVTNTNYGGISIAGSSYTAAGVLAPDTVQLLNLKSNTALNNVTNGGEIRHSTDSFATSCLTIDSNSNVMIGKSAPATSATNGFAYLPTCSGTPSGTPTSKTGFSPALVDSSGTKLWVYVGGAWKYAALV